jgi:hypothetical protein
MATKPVPVENPTPAPEPVQDKSGVHDAAPRKEIVGDYPERPYLDAITPEHLEVLREVGQEPK